jgi:alkanesulfonate monooxygenase SsuD/methylene tetrahydromethanopterin reductase-like flavin-dependent oxidoreductase (luciferase family)
VIPLALSYDLRAPSFGASSDELAAAAIEQCEWADKLGFTSVTLLEHHGSDDSYLPSPLVLGAAIAARTTELLLRVVLILPHHHPVCLAEDIAVLDLISRGRVRLVVAAGYRAEEFDMFGVDRRQRPTVMRESVEVLKQAWTGEPFERNGKTIVVRPRPFQRPRPTITMGGASAAAARRAADIADAFSPVQPELCDVYHDELERLGKPVPDGRPRSGGQFPFVHVSDDPDADFELIAPHAIHESNSYHSWAEDPGHTPHRHLTDAASVRSDGRYLVVRPQECVELAAERGMLAFRPLMGGLHPDLAWQSLRLFEREVLPVLR